MTHSALKAANAVDAMEAAAKAQERMANKNVIPFQEGKTAELVQKNKGLPSVERHMTIAKMREDMARIEQSIITLQSTAEHAVEVIREELDQTLTICRASLHENNEERKKEIQRFDIAEASIRKDMEETTQRLTARETEVNANIQKEIAHAKTMIKGLAAGIAAMEGNGDDKSS